MAFELAPQTWTLMLYGLAIVIGAVARIPGITLMCGIVGFVIGLFTIAALGFWVGLLMMAFAGVIGAVGFSQMK